MNVRAIAMAEDAAAHFERNPDKLWIPGANLGSKARGNSYSDYTSFEEAFPSVDPGLFPTGSMVLVQIRQPKWRTAGGIQIDEETRKTDRDNTQVGRVLAVGALAFHNRTTGELWPEGAWFARGDFVRIPKYRGDYHGVTYLRDDFEIDADTGRRREFQVEDLCIFAMFKDIDILGKWTCDPLTVRAFVL
jgi:co-chaperonin GroES (HSP10)